MSQAQLIRPAANNKPAMTLKINVIRFSLQFMTQTSTSQLHRGVVHYPIKALQGDFNFQVQFRSDDDYKAMQEFLQTAMENSLYPGLNSNALRFLWPELHFDYSGFVKESKMGAQKFDFAPKVMYQMTLTRDSIYTPTADYSEAPEWTAIYGNPGEQIDVAAAVNSANPDPVLPNNPPANNGQPAPAPAPAKPTNPPGSSDTFHLISGPIDNWIEGLFS